MLTINTKNYNLDTMGANQARFVGPAHTFDKVDVVVLTRTAPKPTKDFKGVARADVRLTRTVSTGPDTTANINLGGGLNSIPVGASTSDVDAALNDYAALLGHADIKALFRSHVWPK